MSRLKLVAGKDIPTVDTASHDTLTVLTYELGKNVQHGHQRQLLKVRKLRVTLDEFSNRFISGPNLPTGEELDSVIKGILGFQ